MSDNEQLAALILSEDAQPLGRLAKTLPPLGRGHVRPSLQCLLRWITKGVRSPDGDVIRLQAVRFGDRWISSAQRIAFFCAQLTPVDHGDEEQPHTRLRTKRQRERQIEAAEKRLDDMGVK
jgi:hypothetical protein